VVEVAGYSDDENRIFFGLAPLEICRDFQREREVLMLQQKLVMEV